MSGLQRGSVKFLRSYRSCRQTAITCSGALGKSVRRSVCGVCMNMAAGRFINVL